MPSELHSNFVIRIVLVAEILRVTSRRVPEWRNMSWWYPHQWFSSTWKQWWSVHQAQASPPHPCRRLDCFASLCFEFSRCRDFSSWNFYCYCGTALISVLSYRHTDGLRMLDVWFHAALSVPQPYLLILRLAGRQDAGSSKLKHIWESGLCERKRERERERER